MYRLSNTVRDYPWGSRTAISELLGIEPTGQPAAEMWIGAHPDSPSLATLPGHDGTRRLDDLVAAEPLRLLGEDAAGRYGRLPFLAKVLAAAEPLSLQVHPTLEQARAGFAAEEAAGIDRGAAHRNYKDENHKPEIIFPLTEFSALCGFRDAAASASLFDWLARTIESDPQLPDEGGRAVGVARRTAATLEQGDLRGAFTDLLSGGTDVVQLVDLAATAVACGRHEVQDPGLAELESLAGFHPGDPGVLVSLMLNHLTLRPGQAVYLPAGNIHAYLRGLGVEVMASSDNVLRGGLTGKHMDLPELMDIVDFTSWAVPYLDAEGSDLGQELYRPPFEEFQLQRIALPGEAAMAGDDVAVAQNGPVTLICVAGELVLDSPQGDLCLARGDSVFIPANEAPVVAKRHGDGPALAFAVTTGEPR
ncbi:mannose-6-phosphate isomerase, class I [Arthrobacter sp. JSM 101049]|uniref:mannose-6-phosphate isomerase, class I n=1 Tax=Arthrobacter sp. JSM 101049 TaxID=929097 RepID=UPI003567CD9D